LPPVEIKKVPETKPTTKAPVTTKPTVAVKKVDVVTSPPPTYLPPDEKKGYDYPKPAIPFTY
jgi:hypothetical protein